MCLYVWLFTLMISFCLCFLRRYSCALLVLCGILRHRNINKVYLKKPDFSPQFMLALPIYLLCTLSHLPTMQFFFFPEKGENQRGESTIHLPSPPLFAFLAKNTKKNSHFRINFQPFDEFIVEFF